ncbi:NADPH-dependent 2,4-dienoyl-CoA reductase/sulfur reductase-like enzyme [Streptosporangium becharense]|uniref:NADPH-dependent 2,4-dienoyl-CoA reductase/sulfur reductase-like enzyme n=1 Tax=Streptosporangium becharense TaxID=1816182 RepID=A0A7W9MKE3_9ACTN|nr:FAD-dependent oxidoreductase [Streptosporangium becharense]MBB2914425.1 NADPH-dependent 2,4-dienoyl-CoA reductase/sulfur reductase-like enzyme [Streptosporangium becharense]MBB5823543.1 NADPH-dependent 2,4-dienoyl-CoA reductase/sulfur reductase-like enzyme [Streptosporangium becharense]
MAERLVVIGGDAAGLSAASQARDRRGPDDLRIVAFEKGAHAAYSACGIPYLVGGEVTDVESLVARRPEVFRDELAIDLRLRSEVVEIDLGRRAVEVHDHRDGERRWEPFDQLVVATGAVPVRPDLPGATAEGVHGVQTLDDGIAILRTLRERRPETAVVVGAGYIGLEMAEALVRRGLKVSLVDAAEQPMGTLDPDMGALVADALRDLGVEVHLGERIEGFAESGGRVTAARTENLELPADVVVLGLGTRPNSGLAEAAGIPVGETSGIVTDRRMQTSVEGVWAAGDCVETFHLVSRRPVAIALGTHANKQGRVAGINIGGGYAAFPGVLGTAVSKICEYEVARTGLSSAEAAGAGFETVEETVESTTRAGYYPGARRMRTKMIAERGTGRLLGAQIIGGEGAAKRIDVLAVAVWHGMTVEEMTGLDLSYAPPYAPVWDPVLITARKTAERVGQAAGRDGRRS